MSSAEQYISKGFYPHSQIEGFISVKNYIFVSRQQQNFLLLRFENLADFTADSMEFTLIQMDRTGAVLKKTSHSYTGLTVAPGSTFTLPEGIPVHKYCTDFKLQFSTVTSGRFTYRVRDNAVIVLYTPTNADDSSDVQPVGAIWHHSIKPPKRGKQGLAVLCGICALLLLFGLTAYQMYDRYQDALEEREQASTSQQTQKDRDFSSLPSEE